MELNQKREQSIRKVTLTGTLINCLLAFIKAVVGFLIGSFALIADSLHSFSDLFTDVVVLVGSQLAGKPADESHPFGHGKIETLGTILITILLCGSGSIIVIKAVEALVKPTLSSAAAWIILTPALLSIVTKEWLYHKTVRIAKQTNSTILIANAWHHRTDALSSVVVVIAAIAMFFGWPYGDQWGGIVVGLMVISAGLKIMKSALDELGEASIDQGTRKKIEKVVASLPAVCSWHRLRARRSGQFVLMDIHILVNPELSVVQGHSISKEVEQALQSCLACPLNITIHIEPDIPSEKKEKSF